MSNKIFVSGASLAIAAGSLFASGVAFAEEPANVTIEAQRSQVIGRNSLGGPVELVSITRHVGFSDLDLTKHSDAAQLKQRVSEAATAICGKLDKMYPLAVKGQGNFIPNCVAKARADAMDQVKAAIAAAERKTTGQPAG